MGITPIVIFTTDDGPTVDDGTTTAAAAVTATATGTTTTTTTPDACDTGEIQTADDRDDFTLLRNAWCPSSLKELPQSCGTLFHTGSWEDYVNASAAENEAAPSNRWVSYKVIAGVVGELYRLHPLASTREFIERKNLYNLRSVRRTLHSLTRNHYIGAGSMTKMLFTGRGEQADAYVRLKKNLLSRLSATVISLRLMGYNPSIDRMLCEKMLQDWRYDLESLVGEIEGNVVSREAFEAAHSIKWQNFDLQCDRDADDHCRDDDECNDEDLFDPYVSVDGLCTDDPVEMVECLRKAADRYKLSTVNVV